VRRRYASTAGTGRGMVLLEQLVDDWGVARHSSGKTVWFTLSTGDREPRGRLPWSPEPALAAADVTSVDVELLDMPLLLHAAWQEHAEAILREYLLASLDDEDDLVAVQVHAEATDAIAVLEEHVPRLETPVEPDRLMHGVAEPEVSRPVVTVPVPVTSVQNFDTLDRAIDASLEMARAGLALTPPTQPEIQTFRRWLCRQVAQQAAGARAEPWAVAGEPVTLTADEPDWDVRAVVEAPTGQVAADDANRIIAVSPAALELLGYDEPGELVGRRLVTIIPERYRQAHVAGFTMFLVSGRQPLIGHRVRVPARRRDGSEVPVQMLVEAVQIGDGRSVFVADLAPADDARG
jgi:PAS domain S-box-containing protein